MNIDHYKSWIYETLEYLKRAHYLDWLKACFIINLLLGSMPLFIFIILLLVAPGDVPFLRALVAFLAMALTKVVIVFGISIIPALIYTLGFRYKPHLFLAFTIGKDILFSIILTLVILQGLTLSFMIKCLLGALSLVINLLIMFCFTYLLIRLVIRSIKKRARNQNPSFNQWHP